VCGASVAVAATVGDDEDDDDDDDDYEYNIIIIVFFPLVHFVFSLFDPPICNDIILYARYAITRDGKTNFVLHPPSGKNDS